MSDPLDLFPAFGKNAGGLKQNAAVLQCRIDLDDEVRLYTEPLRTESVSLLDTAFTVAAVLAHVPLARRASDARNGIGPAYDTDHEIAREQAAVPRR